MECGQFYNLLFMIIFLFPFLHNLERKKRVEPDRKSLISPVLFYFFKIFKCGSNVNVFFFFNAINLFVTSTLTFIWLRVPMLGKLF